MKEVEVAKEVGVKEAGAAKGTVRLERPLQDSPRWFGVVRRAQLCLNGLRSGQMIKYSRKELTGHDGWKYLR